MVCMKMPGAGGKLVSLPYCDFGGVLSVDKETDTMLIRQALQAAVEMGLSQVVIRRQAPASGFNGKVLMRMSLPGNSANLLSSFPAKLRSQIKKPQREGLTSAWGGEECLDSFYRVFAKNMRDLGSPTHSLAWFRAVLRGFADLAKVWIVHLPDGQPAAAGITLDQGQVTYVPWASALREYNYLSPNMLLYWAMISHAADSEQAAFEFGRCTPGEGTHRFKKQWGAEALDLDWSVYDSASGDVRATDTKTASPVRRFAESCWRRLPLGTANLAGPLLRRYISL